MSVALRGPAEDLPDKTAPIRIDAIKQSFLYFSFVHFSSEDFSEN